MATAYASSYIFLFPSATETFGNVTLEAMASGTPTLCANATGSSSLVVHGETGYLAEPGDVNSFIEYAHCLIDETEKRMEMRVAARREAESYSWRLILGRINGFYDKILVRSEAA